MITTSAFGALLILVGILLFVVDLHVIGHGLLTAGGIVTLLVGGLLLLWAGVPYSGVLLGALAVVAVLMGGCSWVSWARYGRSEVGRHLPARKGW